MSNVADRVQDRTHWLSLHATIRAMAAVGTWRGDLQARMIADPAVRANPVAFQEELRNSGPLARTRIGYIAVGHEVCQEVLRRDDFKVMTFGGRLPAWLQRVAERTRRERLHPLRPY